MYHLEGASGQAKGRGKVGTMNADGCNRGGVDDGWVTTVGQLEKQTLELAAEEVCFALDGNGQAPSFAGGLDRFAVFQFHSHANCTFREKLTPQRE